MPVREEVEMNFVNAINGTLKAGGKVLIPIPAVGRAQEIRVHVKGAINNGVSKDELREVLMHSAIYCGIPAAVDGFRNASAVLAELGLE